MNKPIRLDVLIVYNKKLATSASNTSDKNLTPFSKNSSNQSYNDVYSYFLETCQKKGLTAAFSTSADITGPGTCRSFWQFKHKYWFKVDFPCFSTLIFAKFSPTNPIRQANRRLLFSGFQIESFNHPHLFNIFSDKQQTYQQFPTYSIPTVSLNNNDLVGINNAKKTLAKLISRHPNLSDFNQSIIMKDRFGAGGRHVYKFQPNQSRDMLAIILKNTNISYIIQPFVKFDQGFHHLNCSASTDLRLVYLGGQIVQFYIRVAKSGEFRCNEHRGGLLTYLSLKNIPLPLIAKSSSIAKVLNDSNSLFALDFIISNNGNIYLLEGNASPGLDWNTSLAKNETEAKKLIKLIVDQLVLRVKTQATNPNPSLFTNPVSFASLNLR